MSPSISPTLQSPAAAALALCVALGSGCAGSPTHESTGQAVDDSVITSEVKSRFVTDKDVSAQAVHVETYKGTVELTGFVDSPSEMTRAAEIATSVKGVKAVRNDLRLKARN